MESDDVPFSDVTNTEPRMIPAEYLSKPRLDFHEDGQQCGCAHRFSVAGLRETLALSPDSKAYPTDWSNSLNLLEFGMNIVPRAEQRILAAKLEAAASAKREQIAGVRIALERLLHLQRKTVHAASHVGSRPPSPNPNAGWTVSSPRREPQRPASAAVSTSDLAIIRSPSERQKLHLGNAFGDDPSGCHFRPDHWQDRR